MTDRHKSSFPQVVENREAVNRRRILANPVEFRMNFPGSQNTPLPPGNNQWSLPVLDLDGFPGLKVRHQCRVAHQLTLLDCPHADKYVRRFRSAQVWISHEVMQKLFCRRASGKAGFA